MSARREALVIIMFCYVSDFPRNPVLSIFINKLWENSTTFRIVLEYQAIHQHFLFRRIQQIFCAYAIGFSTVYECEYECECEYEKYIKIFKSKAETFLKAINLSKGKTTITASKHPGLWPPAASRG